MTVLDKTCVIYLKKSKEHVEFRFRLKKYESLGKNHFLKFFWFFFQRGDPLESELKIYIFQFFKIFNFFLKDDLNETYKMFRETKSWNMSSFEVSTEDLQGVYGGVGKICPALPQIGLIQGLLKRWTEHYKSVNTELRET